MSSSSQLEKWSQGIPCQYSGLPSRATPLRITRATSASLQALIPASLSEERLEAKIVPNPLADENAPLSLRPPDPSFIWQKAQDATVKRYWPRLTMADVSGGSPLTSGVGMLPLAPSATRSGGRRPIAG